MTGSCWATQPDRHNCRCGDLGAQFRRSPALVLAVVGEEDVRCGGGHDAAFPSARMPRKRATPADSSALTALSAE